MAKRIAILGSTGSIGKNALRVIDGLGEGYEVTAVTAHSNAELLAEQVRRYRPKYAAITNSGSYEKLKKELGADVQLLSGAESLVEIASLDEVDIVLTAVVGAAGLKSALAAANHGKRLAIANKEPLVAAGELLTRAVRENGGSILPVDSEHSAIFQAMQSGSADEVSRI
ncbi:MAG: NAD-dependent epimerase/dehydratase family protein, partial [Planctomycetota bacterium]